LVGRLVEDRVGVIQGRTGASERSYPLPTLGRLDCRVLSDRDRLTRAPVILMVQSVQNRHLDDLARIHRINRMYFCTVTPFSVSYRRKPESITARILST
jgi:hypothetical protein